MVALGVSHFGFHFQYPIVLGYDALSAENRTDAIVLGVNQLGQYTRQW